MTVNLADLIAALPAEADGINPPVTAALSEPLSQTSQTPVPIGRVQRMTALGTLQAKIAAAYLFYWLRGWFTSAAENERLLAEAHWRTAIRVLDSMTYLRGAVMKIGQTLANFPDIAPRAFVETLDRLHSEAPPMHWSLLREMVRSELGDDPENIFAEFDKRAFAAASLGQVHRAQLRSGEEVAVKIQYPGIGRAIDADFRNLFLFMLPVRLTRDWEYTRDQCEDLRRRLAVETDYALEAANLSRARTVFADADGILVPRVFSQYSTSRILTMERLEGVTISEFLAQGPSQNERNEVARRVIRAWYRMLYAARLTYADLHPGNFLVLNDGRVGVIDFGFVWQIDAEEWELVRKLDRPMTTGRQDDRIAQIKEWNYIRDDEVDRLRVCDEYAQWCWLCRYHGGEYDFGDEAEMRRGIGLFTEMIRKRYTRARSNAPAIARLNFGVRAILYQLKARIDIRSIAEEEVKATGWDRSDYAGPHSAVKTP
jgi:predicted unusual protein kinase regulating ubiquinone biosynthesis (AarF/ABC1/UbiB family)